MPNPTTESSLSLNEFLNGIVASPVEVFVFGDEDQVSINDGALTVGADKYGFVDQWIDLPSDRHNRGCNFSFADGHVETWKWKAPKKFASLGQPISNSFDRDDLYRLKASSVPDLRR